MSDSIVIEGPLLGMGYVCTEILSDLPDWFGIEEANKNYTEKVEILPTFVAKIDSKVVGFMSLLLHSSQSAELYVLGVLQDHHRQGIGKKLLRACESHLREQGVQYVQVKTLAALAKDPNYEKTREFYEGQDYVTLEVFPELWDPHNPCLQLIKGL
jgi:ribosomal protein S18 acetylase RimI-like enzyme